MNGKLKKIRIYADLTQQEIADIFGVSRSTYGMWEQGRDFVPLTHLIKYCDYFHLSLDYVLDFSDIKQYENEKEGIDPILLAKRIKLIRRLNNVTQKQLAQDLNITNSSISKYENGINLPLTSYLIAFCKYFNISSDYVTGRIEEEIKLKELSKTT